MTDIHPTQIVNTTRNSNTTLQSSTLQSAKSLSKSYSFQSLRTVKGVATLSNTDGRVEADVCLINEYDGSPIQLYPGDIVLNISVNNGNPSFKYPNNGFTGSLFNARYPIPFIPPNDSNGPRMILSITPEPTFNNISQTWIPDTTSCTDLFIEMLLLANLSIRSRLGNLPVYIPLSFNSTPLYSSAIGSINNNSYTSYTGKCRWLTCRFNSLTNPIIVSVPNQTLSTVSVNITLVILNPTSVE